MSAALRPLKWFYHEFGLGSIHETGRNAYLIILARTCRTFAYGTNALILAIFFSALEFSDHQIGIFMTLTLLGDLILGTFLTLIADHVGRRRVLLAGSFLMTLSGVIFALSENFWVLLLAAVIGVISVTGGDFGPFRSIEESVISQLTTPSSRSDVLAWYVTTSTLGSSIGSEASGRIIKVVENVDGWSSIDAYHAIFWIYGAMGLVNTLLVLLLTKECELNVPQKAYAQIPVAEDSDDEGAGDDRDDAAGLTAPNQSADKRGRIWSWLITNLSQISAPTRSIMYKLWFLLALDSLADGMVPYSLTNYFLDLKFHPEKSTLGDVTAISYFLSSLGAVFAGPLARKIGLVNTMVFTHVPSSAAVLFFTFPPTFWPSAFLLFVRAGLNNMDQAPRAAFIAGVVKPEERTAAMGITTMLRTLAALGGPTFTGFLAADQLFGVAFLSAGTCRLLYDFGLYALFVNTPLHQHETRPDGGLNVHEERRGIDEEEVLEMASLTESDSDGSLTHVSKDERIPVSALDIPLTKTRSRSPHRAEPKSP